MPDDRRGFVRAHHGATCDNRVHAASGHPASGRTAFVRRDAGEILAPDRGGMQALFLGCRGRPPGDSLHQPDRRGGAGTHPVRLAEPQEANCRSGRQRPRSGTGAKAVSISKGQEANRFVSPDCDWRALCEMPRRRCCPDCRFWQPCRRSGPIAPAVGRTRQVVKTGKAPGRKPAGHRKRRSNSQIFSGGALILCPLPRKQPARRRARSS